MLASTQWLWLSWISCFAMFISFCARSFLVELTSFESMKFISIPLFVSFEIFSINMFMNRFWVPFECVFMVSSFKSLSAFLKLLSSVSKNSACLNAICSKKLRFLKFVKSFSSILLIFSSMKALNEFKSVVCVLAKIYFK